MRKLLFMCGLFISPHLFAASGAAGMINDNMEFNSSIEKDYSCNKNKSPNTPKSPCDQPCNKPKPACPTCIPTVPCPTIPTCTGNIGCSGCSSNCCPPKGSEGQRGPQGTKGSKGERGYRGMTGATGCTGCTGCTGANGGASIANVIEATSISSTIPQIAPQTVLANRYVSFSSPIAQSVNGVDSPGGMTLIESTFGSGNFDTILLPAETSDMYYLVGYGVAPTFITNSTTGTEIISFGLELNSSGSSLPYTVVGVTSNNAFQLISKTSIVVNPANTLGTLRIRNESINVVLTPFPQSSSMDMNINSLSGVRAFINVTQLNNN